MLIDPLSAITSALQKEKIIPDLVPAELAFTPSVLFSVVFPNGSEVNLGNELTVEETQDEPEIRLAALNGPWDDAPETSYTLAMLDPDAPYRTEAIYRSFRHWVVCDLCCYFQMATCCSRRKLMWLSHIIPDCGTESTCCHVQLRRGVERTQDASGHDAVSTAWSPSKLGHPSIQ